MTITSIIHASGVHVIIPNGMTNPAAGPIEWAIAITDNIMDMIQSKLAT
jgi:hypothetical protein